MIKEGYLIALIGNCLETLQNFKTFEWKSFLLTMTVNSDFWETHHNKSRCFSQIFEFFTITINKNIEKSCYKNAISPSTCMEVNKPRNSMFKYNA